MPNLAQSIVPAVVGETNLFCVSCCMMSPHILRLIPVSKIAISFGILVSKMISSWVVLSEKISSKLIRITPINKLIIPKTTSKIKRIFKLNKCLKSNFFLIVIIIIKNKIVF